MVRETLKLKINGREKSRYKPAVVLALISLLICGLFFPFLITGLAQVFMPYQANGEIVQLNNHKVGSNLIAQNFTLPIFFHPRNDSASGVDPDITLQDAYSQIPRIQNTTGIPLEVLKLMVDQNVEGKFWIIGSPYLNLIKMHPSIYKDFQ